MMAYFDTYQRQTSYVNNSKMIELPDPIFFLGSLSEEVVIWYDCDFVEGG